MTTIKTSRSRAHMVATVVEPRTQRAELLWDCMLAIMTIGGAIGGAVGGIMLGAEFGTTFPVTWGTLGTMLGSGLFTGMWCLLERFGIVRFTGNDGHHDHNAIEG